MPLLPSLPPADRFTIDAAVAPLTAEPRISSPLTSQLLHGEVVTVLDGHGDWLRVHGADGYAGWMHQGYLRPTTGREASWRLSLGCVTRDGNGAIRPLPLGARVAPQSEVIDGLAIDADSQAVRFPCEAGAIVQSARSLFAGAPYVWGGVSPWGVDCSGLVQRVCALHGIALPRDAWQQAEAIGATPAALTAAHVAASLLFFSDRDDRRITHVGIATGDGHLVHSALSRGGVAVERLDADDAYVARLRQQVVAAGPVRTLRRS